MIKGTAFSTILRTKLKLAYGPENQSIDTVMSSMSDPRVWFREYLLVTHSIIRSSVPLMQSAYQRCNQLQKDDLLITGLIKYFGKHIQEETGHDEWLLNDLETIGVSRQEALSHKPLQAVAELVGSQYYWIYHWHPVTLLGYIAYLEGDPPTRELIRNLEGLSGYPHTAFRTLIKHSELDPHHSEELNQTLDTFNLTTQYQRWITSNALHSADKFHEIRNYSSNASRNST